MANKMHVQMQAPGLLGKVLVILIGSALLVFVFLFSVLVLVPLGLVGALILGTQFRRIKWLRKQMYEQSSEKHVIEGEVIYETTATETKQLK